MIVPCKKPSSRSASSNFRKREWNFSGSLRRNVPTLLSSLSSGTNRSSSGKKCIFATWSSERAQNDGTNVFGMDPPEFAALFMECTTIQNELTRNSHDESLLSIPNFTLIIISFFICPSHWLGANLRLFLEECWRSILARIRLVQPRSWPLLSRDGRISTFLAAKPTELELSLFSEQY